MLGERALPEATLYSSVLKAIVSSLGQDIGHSDRNITDAGIEPPSCHICFVPNSSQLIIHVMIPSCTN
jgi:hypothetical protein